MGIKNLSFGIMTNLPFMVHTVGWSRYREIYFLRARTVDTYINFKFSPVAVNWRT